MYATTTTANMMPPAFSFRARPLTVQSLAPGHESEVLAFLAKRPIHTVIMAGFIRDSGLINPRNRGTFYGCRDSAGQLKGVALIGHVTMVETESDEALELFAGLAHNYQRAHVIVGEQEKVERFWEFYSPAGQAPRRLCRELLLEQCWPAEPREPINLRRATLEDIEMIVPVHAQMAFDECGINPLDRDPVGFRQRVANRIEQGRTWVWTDQGRLIFKADVVSDTPEAIYLEGIYTNAELRGKGYGSSCVSQLSRTLQATTALLCVLVNDENRAAQVCYQKAGYELRGYYDTIYLQTDN